MMEVRSDATWVNWRVESAPTPPSHRIAAHPTKSRLRSRPLRPTRLHSQLDPTTIPAQNSDLRSEVMI